MLLGTQSRRSRLLQSSEPVFADSTSDKHVDARLDTDLLGSRCCNVAYVTSTDDHGISSVRLSHHLKW